MSLNGLAAMRSVLSSKRRQISFTCAISLRESCSSAACSQSLIHRSSGSTLMPEIMRQIVRRVCPVLDTEYPIIAAAVCQMEQTYPAYFAIMQV